MRTIIGDYESGQLNLLSDSKGTCVSIRWPADRELDEWIDFSLKLSVEDEVNIASSAGAFSVGEPNNGIDTINFKDGRVRLRCSGANSIGPVQADLALDEEAFVTFRKHFALASTSRP